MNNLSLPVLRKNIGSANSLAEVDNLCLEDEVTNNTHYIGYFESLCDKWVFLYDYKKNTAKLYGNELDFPINILRDPFDVILDESEWAWLKSCIRVSLMGVPFGRIIDWDMLDKRVEDFPLHMFMAISYLRGFRKEVRLKKKQINDESGN